LPPERELTVTAFADRGDPPDRAHPPRPLLDLAVLEAVPDASPQRYRLAESPVVEELVALNSALNAAGAGGE